jgi:hypothetical protein
MIEQAPRPVTVPAAEGGESDEHAAITPGDSERALAPCGDGNEQDHGAFADTNALNFLPASGSPNRNAYQLGRLSMLL